ncbi:plastocyanin [Methanosarcinales archaeon]|nr:plastocyanin [Methanosarcinales archaeon]
MKLINAIRMIEERKIFQSLVLILLTIAVSGCTLKPDEPANNISMNRTPIPTETPIPFLFESRTVYVEIFGSVFNPSELNVVNGTTVRWINKDSSQHTILINDISSPSLNKRESWNYTFDRSGTFEYSCTIQTWMLRGRIIVR